MADGSILLGGHAQTTPEESDGAGRQWIVVKLTGDGAFDTAFNGTGGC